VYFMCILLIFVIWFHLLPLSVVCVLSTVLHLCEINYILRQIDKTVGMNHCGTGESDYAAEVTRLQFTDHCEVRSNARNPVTERV